MVALWVIGSVVWLAVYLVFQTLDSFVQGRWSLWLRTHSIQVTKGCVIWSLKLAVPTLKTWCKIHRRVLRLFFQLGSIVGVMACCILMLGLVITGITMYLIFVSCVVTQSIFWRLDPWQLANKFPLISSFKKLLMEVTNALLFHLMKWLKLDPELPLTVSWLLCWVGLLVILPFHELGHAITAYVEGIGVEKVGLFLAFYIPGMFVTIEESLLDLNTKSRLRIVCAGFWFNLLLCLLSLVVVFLLPLLVAPFFRQQMTVSGFISTGQESSRLLNCFSIGDGLVSVNNREIRKLDDIKEVIRELTSETFVGICLNKNNITSSKWFRPFHMCCPGLSSDSWQVEESVWKCFVQSSFFNTGYPNAVCISEEWLETQEVALGFCEDKLVDDQYFVPYTGTGGRLVSLKRWIPSEQNYHQTVLVTSPDALLHSVKWTEYVPRISPWWLYKFLIIWNPIGKFEQFFRILFILSAFIGISNMAPVWRMDGEDVFSWLLTYFPLPMTHLEYLQKRKRWLGYFSFLFILSFVLFFILMDLNN
ncbi:Membrane-bound transcription factor site-2 protease [Galdieria sulphuraria]|nr:Membrane-bound transcription factor site-2 protease [Galdieria sulphuraria]